MNNLWFLVGSSLKKKVKSKWFIGINLVIFLLIFFTFHMSDIIMAFGGDYKEERKIVVLDKALVYPKFEELMKQEESFDITYPISYLSSSLEEALQLVRKDSSVILVEILRDEHHYIKSTIYSSSNVATITKTAIHNTLNTIKKEIAISELGLSEEVLSKIYDGVPLNYQLLDFDSNETREDTSNVIVSVVVLVFIMISFFIIIHLVQMVGAEINDEKTNKTMEIIISDVPPKIHFLSKLLSSIFFNMIQVGLFGVYGFVSTMTRSSQTNSSFIYEILNTVMTKEVVRSIVSILPVLGVFFIITLLTYAMLSAILASVTTNIDDFQQLQTPLMLLVSLGLYLSIFAMIFEGSFLVKAFSYVPLLSFMLSPTLYFLNQISMTSLILSMIVSIVFMFLVYHFGIRIYQMGILNYSGDHLWSKMWKALKNRD